MDFEAMTAKTVDTTEADKAEAIAELTGTTESIEPEIEQDTPEPIAKAEEEDAPKEETPPEETKTKTEDEIRREVEKDLRKKYLSQVSIKSREAEEAKAKLTEMERQRDASKERYDNWEGTAEEYIESMVDAKLHKQDIDTRQKQIQELDNYEKQEFLKINSDSQSYISKLEEIKQDNPNMSWSAANTFYLAMTNPEALVRKTTNLDLGGGTPKAIFNPEPSLDDLKKAAMEETNQWAGQY